MSYKSFCRTALARTDHSSADLTHSLLGFFGSKLRPRHQQKPSFTIPQLFPDSDSHSAQRFLSVVCTRSLRAVLSHKMFWILLHSSKRALTTFCLGTIFGFFFFYLFWHIVTFYGCIFVLHPQSFCDIDEGICIESYSFFILGIRTIKNVSSFDY